MQAKVLRPLRPLYDLKILSWLMVILFFISCVAVPVMEFHGPRGANSIFKAKVGRAGSLHTAARNQS